MVAWNQVPRYIEAQPGSQNGFVIKKLVGLGAFSFFAARFGSTLINDPSSASSFAVAAYTAAVILGVMAVQAALAIGERKPIWDALSEGQRKLLGMGPSSRPAAPPARTRSAAEPLVTPPSRAARPFLQPIVTGEEPQQGLLRTPGSKGSARNVTPDQLQRMMEELDEHVDAAAAQTATGAADYGAFAGASGVQPGVSSLGGGNTYRPSAIPRGTAAAPLRSDGRITQSQPAQRGAVLHEMGVREDALEVGIEQAREWFASDVLKPLMVAVHNAHLEVIAGAAQLGFPGVRLTPLTDLGTDNANKTADDSLMLAQISGRIEEYLRNPANQSNRQLLNCMQAIITYQKLLLLLRGEYPSSLLPPTPDGYLLKRIEELANGSCMLEFKWNGGGEWNRKSWSADLPTDSAILFYLFAAFLAAPKWVFRNEDPSRIESPNGVLYLGKIPPRVTGEYYAIIPTRPPAKSKGTGVVGLQLGTREPHFSLLRQGEILLTETGQAAFFRITVLFLHHCRQHGNVVGGRNLDYLNVGHLVSPPTFSLRRFKKAFRMW
ncbi:hypothetical protein Ndes2437B_g01024 [Nannochloris sp. 'desiccata']